jgi:N-acyl amino acid synthase of PEP-CTERM/exosortase system
VWAEPRPFAGTPQTPQPEPGFGPLVRSYFDVVPAFSDALKDEVYRIRHAVFCEELGYEPPQPDGREIDEYDAHSQHLLIRNVQLGEFMGCTRLVRARPRDPHYPLPFEKTCAATLDRSVVDPAALAREAIGEFSRLAILARFRKRKGEEQPPAGLSKNPRAPLRPRFPYMLASLFLGTVELARLNGIETLFILTEERVARHLRMLGVKIEVVGAPTEHRGPRLPSMMSPSGIIDNLDMLVRPLYRTVAAEVAQGGWSR